jgi:hypothetical protein
MGNIVALKYGLEKKESCYPDLQTTSVPALNGMKSIE